jgi:hypothetical protein
METFCVSHTEDYSIKPDDGIGRAVLSVCSAFHWWHSHFDLVKTRELDVLHSRFTTGTLNPE